MNKTAVRYEFCVIYCKRTQSADTGLRENVGLVKPKKVLHQM